MSALVACLGNVFRGDDAFGVETARRLAARPPIPGAVVRDFGIRGLDFAYALLEPWDAVIVVDATPRGRAPGTLYVLEPAREDLPAAGTPAELDAHGMDPLKALRWAASMGARLPAVRVVGCEPAAVGGEDEILDGLSPAVAAAVDGAVELVESLCTSWD